MKGYSLMAGDLKTARRDFMKGILTEDSITEHPLDLLKLWYDDAVKAGAPDANAMALATLDAQGYPVSRIVLLRDMTSAGLSFFTNYNSAKGLEIGKEPKGSLLFFWPGLERQVRIAGAIARLSNEESDLYFQSRPRESQIGAWASPQSAALESRDELERLVAHYSEKFAQSGTIPRPPHWGGYRLCPVAFEFWQGRESRLHDRLKAKSTNGGWVWGRLAP